MADGHQEPNDGTISAIEVHFAIPVHLTSAQRGELIELVEAIARANQPAGQVHWLSGWGSKPQFSQADARFLGKPVDPTAPAVWWVPTFDDSIFYLETCCRDT